MTTEQRTEGGGKTATADACAVQTASLCKGGFQSVFTFLAVSEQALCSPPLSGASEDSTPHGHTIHIGANF